MPKTMTGEKNMEDYKNKIIERIKKEGKILDISLAPYFDRDPRTFHEEVKRSAYAKSYTFYGLRKIDGRAITWKYGTTEYDNMLLGGIRPFTEACILSKEDIVNDLAVIFPQHKEEIEVLVILLK